MKHSPTQLRPGERYTFRLGDKIKFYWRDNEKKHKAWKAFSDVNPFYAAYCEVNGELFINFHSIDKHPHTNGIVIGRMFPATPLLHKATLKDEKDGNWYTHVTIGCPMFKKQHDRAFLIIPQVSRPK